MDSLSPVLTFLVPTVSVVVWLVRLEGKVKQSEKDIARIETGWIETNKEMLISLKSLESAINDLNLKLERVMGKMEHMNTKVTTLEANKIEPILKEYYSKHND